MVNVTPFVRPSSLSESVAAHLRDYFNAHPDRMPPAGVYDRVLAEVERPLIEQCLDVCHGNQIKAAELLGINRNTLRKKIRELNIIVTRGSATQQRLKDAA